MRLESEQIVKLSKHLIKIGLNLSSVFFQQVHQVYFSTPSLLRLMLIMSTTAELFRFIVYLFLTY